MRGVYIDCSFGAAGDMLLSSLIDAGADVDFINKELKKLDIGEDSFELVLEPVRRCTIQSQKLTVKCFMANHEHHEHHEHHGHDSHHGHNGDHSHGRHYTEIRDLIERSEIEAGAKSLALEIFASLARAESKVHGRELETVHFHEVGALDAIVDIVGFALAYSNLGIESARVAAPPLGSGTIETEHGLFPVPAPAVAHLLAEAGAPSSNLSIPFECLTPTGAAILCTVADSWGSSPCFEKIDAIGSGAGTLDPAGHPNAVRVILGDVSSAPGAKDEGKRAIGGSSVRSEVVAVLESNIDDMAPDLLAFAHERLMQEGALDVAIVPATMKKGRSGHCLQVITAASDRERFERIIFEETSTLGLRVSYVERLALNRTVESIVMPENGRVNIKVAFDEKGALVNLSPEFRDCAAYAKKHSLPLKQVFEMALASYRSSKGS